MKRVRIDFAPRTAGAMIHGLSLWWWPLLALGVLSGLGVLTNLWALQHEMAPLGQELHALQQRLSDRVARPRQIVASPITPVQAVAVNAAIGQLNLPWSEVLDAVEDASGPRVALVELTPDARRKMLRGVAEAATSDAMIAYIERLKAQALFTSVLLVKHEINEQDKNKPVRFQFEALWQEMGS